MAKGKEVPNPNEIEIPEGEAFVRVRLPKGRETLGVVEQRLGGSRMNVRCLDGKTRNCRIPGALKKQLWVREGDFVIVEPWEYSGETRGDVLYKYRANQVHYLKNKGYLTQIEDLQEF